MQLLHEKEKAGSCAIKSPDPYKFRSIALRKFVLAIDRIGGMVSRTRSDIEWETVRHIAILRLDHMGDTLLLVPLIHALRRKYPKMKISLIVGPWSKGIAENIDGVHNVHIFNAPWMRRPDRRNIAIGAIIGLSKVLNQGGFDVVVDLRGDVRHIISMWLSGVKKRIGLKLTGGQFLLTNPAEFDPKLHIAEQNIHTLNQTGANLEVDLSKNRMKTPGRIPQKSKQVIKRLSKGKRLLVIHMACEVASRRWERHKWKMLIDKIPLKYDICLIGATKDVEETNCILSGINRKVINSVGELSVIETLCVLKRASLFIGVNSGPGHMAAAVNTPIISLFSGTEPSERWRPLGNRVTVIRKKTVCGPCDRSLCPFDNMCMKRITVREVLRGIQRLENA